MANPPRGEKISNISEFKTKVKPGSHIAVRRPCYLHHYLVIDVNENYVLIIHYTSHGPIKGIGKVTEETLSLNKKLDNLNFEKGLYLVIKDGYPSSFLEVERTIQKARSRKEETDYNVAYNNCETYVAWALTGVGKCEQFENASFEVRALCDFLDATLCNYRRSTVKTVADKLLHTGVVGVEKKVQEEFFKSTSKLFMKTASTTGSKVATAAVSSAAAAPIELIFLVHEVGRLNKYEEDGFIDKKTRQRQVTKQVVGSVGSVGAGAAGAVIGQTIIPIPIVGAAAGGIIGNLIGRVASSSVTGFVFDQFNSFMT